MNSRDAVQTVSRRRRRSHPAKGDPARLFHSKGLYFNSLLLLLDVSISIAVFLWVLYVHQRVVTPGSPSDTAPHIGLLAVYLTVFVVMRSYSAHRSSGLGSRSMVGQARRLASEVVIASFTCIVLIFIFKLQFVSRFVLISFLLISFLLMFGSRMALRWWYYTKGKEADDYTVNALIIGSGRRAHMLADCLQAQPDLGVRVIGFLDPTGESAGRRKEDRILGGVNQITSVLRDNIVEEVVVAVPRDLLGDIRAIVDACEEEGVKISFMANIYDFKAARTRLTLVEGIPLLSFEPVARPENALLAKRTFDLAVTLAALPFLLALTLVIAIIIKLDSPGPVFFAQTRVGLNKKNFKMFKFRSMVVDAEQRMSEVEHLNEAEGPNFKIENDPRITRAGRFLRKTSLDELPQLFNVLIGDMSLVGPRPMSIRDVSLFDHGRQRKRFSVRPGITCLWQISGRSNLSFDEWLDLDIEYIETWSFWLDLRILLKTVPVVIRGSGAV